MNLKSYLKHIFLFVAAAVLWTTAASAQVHTSNTYRYLLTSEEVLKHLEFLTSEDVAGRGAGTSQAMKTAEYIAACL